MLDLAAHEQSIQISMPLTIKYSDIKLQNKLPLTLILLHGYGETKDRLLHKTYEEFQKLSGRIIAINGPLPLPQYTAEAYKEGYAWYFRSRRQGVTLVAPSACREFFSSLVRQLDLADSPIVVIGYSQGAYVLPLLARDLHNLQALIGIGGGALEEEFPELAAYDFHLIHATEDEICPIDQARKEFQQVCQRFKSASFIAVEGKHRLDSAKIAAVSSLLKKLYSQN
ncbi:MAG: hypothetical protein KBD78_02915 [Oligoflexales bacterium]|nr:hypothetical protein [Oligoflexales bacterium]